MDHLLDRLNELPKASHGRNKIGPIERMFLHRGPLVRRQLVGLAQDRRVLLVDLSYVVE